MRARRHLSVRRALVTAFVAVAVAGPLGIAATPGAAAEPGNTTGDAGRASAGTPYKNPRLPVRARVTDLMSRMTLADKIGQMTQAERAATTSDPGLVQRLALGSLLSGGGSTPTPNTATAWADMVDEFQRQALSTRLGIPLLYGVDSVHGHNNLYGATVFPHNIGLGATRDPSLVRDIASVTAEETRATGPQWVFGPCLCVALDDRWGRTYESYSENPFLVDRMATSIDGLQGRPARLSDTTKVLATAKHYAGDGDTRFGTGSGDYTIDQGVTITSRPRFWVVDLQQYLVASNVHDVGSVMPSFSSVDWTEDGVGNPVKMHASSELIAGTLKTTMRFDGLVISDWEAIHQIPDPSAPDEGGLTAYKVRVGVNAGTDMFMEPYSAGQFVSLLTAEVQAGRVSMNRINDAVRRILTAKFELGLFERPFTDRSRIGDIGSADHRALARRAVAESQVLLKNARTGWTPALPLRSPAGIYVAGSNADDIGNQAGGWTITWQGGSGPQIPGDTILDGIEQAATGAPVTFSEDASTPVPAGTDVGIVVVGETPYSEGFGDVGGPLWAYDPSDNGVPRPEKTMLLSSADNQAVDTVCSAVETCIVSVVSGRPMVIDQARLNRIDGLVASWLPGSEGAGVADVLFGSRPFTGKLPMTWPRSVDQEPINIGDRDYDPLYPYGWGLRTRSTTSAAPTTAAETAFLTASASTSPTTRGAAATAFATAEQRADERAARSAGTGR